MSARIAYWITSSDCVWSVMTATLYGLASRAGYGLLRSHVLVYFLRAPTLSQAESSLLAISTVDATAAEPLLSTLTERLLPIPASFVTAVFPGRYVLHCGVFACVAVCA